LTAFSPHILAKGGEWIGFAIFVAIWALGALASWLKKAARQQDDSEFRRQARQSIQQRVQAAEQVRARLAAGIAQRFPDVLLPPNPQRRKPPPVPRRVVAPARMPRVIPQARVPVPPPPVAKPVPASPIVLEEVRERMRSSARANQIARWLKPVTLRQQYILTELLQPPIAFRENFR